MPDCRHRVVVKSSDKCKHQARRMGCLRPKTKLRIGFRGGFLKATLEVRAAGCMLSLWAFFSCGEITGDALGILIISLLVPACPGSAHSPHPPPGRGGGGLSFRRTTQRYSSDCCVYPLRETGAVLSLN